MKEVETLIEALPYIKQFKDKVFVIKVGGSIISDKKTRESILQDVALLSFVGIKPVIVHGAGPEISDLTKKLGKKVKFIEGLRYTDEETLNIVKMVLGKVNSEIVGDIQKFGCDSIGITAKSGKLIETTKIEKLGYVGKVSKVKPKVLLDFFEKGYVPVIEPIGVDEKGDSVNINADEVASAIAKELKAEKLIFLTDVPGLLDQVNDKSSLISKITTKELRQKLEWFELEGGMIPKIKAVIGSIDAGVKSIHIIEGRKKHSLLLEVFTKTGVGTLITK